MADTQRLCQVGRCHRSPLLGTPYCKYHTCSSCGQARVGTAELCVECIEVATCMYTREGRRVCFHPQQPESKYCENHTCEWNGPGCGPARWAEKFCHDCPGQLSTAPTDATSRKKSAEEAPIDWHRSGSVLTRLPGRVSKKKSATIRLSRLVNPLESVEEDSVSRTKSQEEASWFNCLENGVIPATLSEYVQKFKAAAVVLKGEGSPDEVGWSSTDTVSGIAEGIVALITMLDVYGADGDDVVDTMKVKKYLLQTISHLDVFFSGRAGDITYAKPLFDAITHAASKPLARMPRALHAYVLENDLLPCFEYVPSSAYQLVQEDGTIVRSDGAKLGKLVDHMWKQARAGLTQSRFVPYLQRAFDPVVMKELSEFGGNPYAVLITMLAIHSEFVDVCLNEDYPDGVGHEVGVSRSAATKTGARMLTKAVHDYHYDCSAEDQPPNRPGESWYPGNAPNDPDLLDSAPPAPSCIGGYMTEQQGQQGAQGSVPSGHTEADPLSYARAATAVACLCDTVRFSLTTDGKGRSEQAVNIKLRLTRMEKDDPARSELERELEVLKKTGSPHQAIRTQEVFLQTLNGTKVGDVETWRLLRVKNTLYDPDAAVKYALCNFLYTPVTDSPVLDAEPSLHEAFNPLNTPHKGGLRLPHRPITFADMIAHKRFSRTVASVQERDALPQALVDTAVRLLKHPSFQHEPIKLVVELQMYIPEFLKKRKLMHGFYKLARARNDVALTTDCAEDGVEGSLFRCTPERAHSRVAVEMVRMNGKLRGAIWELGDLTVAHWPALAEKLALSTCTAVELDFGGIKVCAEGVGWLVTAMKRNTSVRRIKLASCCIEEAGQLQLATIMKIAPQVSIDLTGVDLSDRAAAAISAVAVVDPGAAKDAIATYTVRTLSGNEESWSCPEPIIRRIPRREDNGAVSDRLASGGISLEGVSEQSSKTTTYPAN